MNCASIKPLCYQLTLSINEIMILLSVLCHMIQNADTHTSTRIYRKVRRYKKQTTTTWVGVDALKIKFRKNILQTLNCTLDF